MTAPPLPASPCLRVKLDYLNGDGSEAGSRFYLSYAGAAPTAGNCITLATDIAAAWNTNIAPQISNFWSLQEVDVLDLASLSGSSGIVAVSHQGSNGSNLVPASVAVNVEFDIARRYRGGKPRMFLPPGDASQLANGGRWSNDYVTAVNAALTAFMAEIQALSVGAVGALAHVNLSYYSGFKNVTNSSGRERAVPLYRDTALLDSVSSYACKAVVGSQRRRRTATTY